MDTEIIKVQVPLSDPAAAWLAYSADLQRMAFFEPSEAVKAALGGDPKGYFEAQWMDATGTFEIGKRVAEQPW
jgi:hypothetical protein